MTDTLVASGALHTAFRSDPGRVRTNNEDLALVDPARGIFGVIDGVGGSVAGEIAAAIARDVILHRLSRPLGTPRERVREAIALANNEIFKRAERSPELHGMSCVVTLAIVAGDVLTIGHVGDTRLYTLGAQGLRKLTHDHSPVGEREDARELSEVDAMRHPRRNELYRDVGGVLHDKDDDEFVEVIETPWEAGQALLLCTDGLTDLVPSTIIERLVRRHAGSPQQVVDTLVEAANDAGGTDNVTVVYVESAGFAGLARRGAPASAAVVAPDRSARRDGRRPSVLRRIWSGPWAFACWVVRSRTTWFAAGAIVGVLAALALAWRVAESPPRSRTLTVGAETPGSFPRIAEALAAARAGDLVRVEPGVYAERILVPDGVDLVARVPGSVVMRRAAAAAGPWVAIEATGTQGGRLAGIRVESTAEAAIDVGLRVSGHGRTVELFDLAGPVDAAIEVLASSTLVLRGSVVEAPAVALRLEDGAHATLANNIVSRSGRGRVPPLSMAGSSQLVLSRNVLAGFGTTLANGTAGRDQVDVSGNLVIPGGPNFSSAAPNVGSAVPEPRGAR